MKNSEAENKLINIIADLYEMDLREQNPKTRKLVERAIGGLVRAKAELEDEEVNTNQEGLFHKTISPEQKHHYLKVNKIYSEL